MDFRKLGKSDIQASVIGFGGEWLVDRTQEDVTAIFDECFKHGINILDLFLPQPTVRDMVGVALKGRREKMIIQGHICTVFSDNQYKRSRVLSEVRASFEDQLARLQTDYIDIGMVHFVDSDEDLDACFDNGIFDYAKELKANGTIKQIGLSSHNPKVALRACKTGLIETLMFSINPAYDLEHADADIGELTSFKGLSDENWQVAPEREELYRYCEANGIAITVMKSLAAATLLDAQKSPFGIAMSVPACIHYGLTRPAVSSIMVGFSEVSQIADSIKYLTATDEEKDYSSVLSRATKVDIKGKCMYCNHCLPCPVGIDIAAVNKYLDIATAANGTPESVSQHYKSLDASGANCIKCGSCESNCPFDVSIIERMERAAEIFG